MKITIEQYKNFDLPESITFTLLLAVFTFYIILSVPELRVDECLGTGHCYDFDRRMGRLYVWDSGQFLNDFRHSFHFGLLVLSNTIFNNYKVLGLVSSACLLLVTFLFTKQITQKRYAGVVAMFVLLGSKIFYFYDTSVTYPSFWATFFILSLYLTIKKPYLSVFSYIISIPMKLLTIGFLPASLAFIWLSEGSKKNKIKLISAWIIVIVILICLIYFLDNDLVESNLQLLSHFDFFDFVSGIGDWANSYRFDVFGLFMLTISICLLLMLKNVPYSRALLITIMLMLFILPVMRGFTTYDSWPYRFLPYVVLTSISFGLIISNLDKIDTSRFAMKKLDKTRT